MADTSIFEINDVDVELFNYTKIRQKAVLGDSIILKCLVYSQNLPVNLENFKVEFRATLPKSGQVYSEVDNMIKNGNELTITCDQILTSEIGEVISSLRLWDSQTKQKSSYQIVIKVLSTIISDETIATKSVLSALNSLDLSINKYMELKVDLNGLITLAETTITNINTSITNADVSKIALDLSKTNADNSKIALDTSKTNADALKIALDNTIETADVSNTNLTNINTSANTTSTTLQGKIDTADAKLLEFKNFDTTGIVASNNTMLGEMYCKNELLSINHNFGTLNLNPYPVVQLIYTELGAGIGGAGIFPAGADSQCNLMQNKTVYTDNNNLTIYVPDNYFIASPSIEKVNDYKYIVTFPSSTRSILIQLKI